jgi:hypothetical protein
MKFIIKTVGGDIVAGTWDDGSIKYVGASGATEPLLFNDPNDAYRWFASRFPSLPPAEHREPRPGDGQSTRLIVEWQPPAMTTPGQIGYDAYGGAANWRTFDGRPMPTWEQLGATDTGRETQRRWEVAADAVGIACVSRPVITGEFYVATWEQGSGLLMFLRPDYTGSGFEIERAWRFTDRASASVAAEKIGGRVVSASAVEAASFRACEAHRVMG